MIGMFSAIPYYIYEVNNWQEKKQRFSEYLINCKYERLELNGLGDFETDRNNKRNYIDPFLLIFQEELQQFGKDINVSEFTVKDIWSVQYKKHDHHPAHTHGRSNMSGILYFDYDDQEHSPTHFITNNTNPFSNMTDIISPIVKEGTFFMFPANVLHFTLPNKSEKIRKVISFDITISGGQ